MAKFKSGNLDLKTNQKIRLGDSLDISLSFDGSDFKMVRDGSPFIIVDSSGNIEVEGVLEVGGDIYCDDLHVSGDTIFVGTGEIKSTGGNVELYYDGVKTIETFSGGVNIYDDSASDYLYITENGGTAAIVNTVEDGEIWILGESTGQKSVFEAKPGAETSLFYSGSKKFETTSTGSKITNTLVVTSTVNVGEDDTTKGSLNLYGAAVDNGGELRIYTAANSDTVFNYYSFRANEQRLEIGTDDDPDSLTYGRNLQNVWHFMNGSVSIGVSEPPLNGPNIRGNLTLGSEDTGGDLGGSISIATAIDYYNDIVNYQIRVNEDDFYIGFDDPTATGDLDALKYDGGLEKWILDGRTNGVELRHAGSAVFQSEINGVSLPQTYLYLGQDDAENGRLYIYGDNANTGGIIRLYSGANDDADINYYRFFVTDGSLAISAEGSSTEAIFYTENNQKWTIRASSGVELYHGGFNDKKLETDTTGVVVFGSVRADDLIVDGDSIFLGNTTITEKSGGGIEVNGQSVNVTELKKVYGDSTAVAGDVLLVDSTGTTITLINSFDARVDIKALQSGVVTIVPQSGTIDDSPTLTITTKYQSYTLVCDGTDWWII